MPDFYNGIDSEFTGAFKSRGSKFYAYLFPAHILSEFNSRVKALWEENPDATHICTAAVIGKRNEHRFNDDGEPGNSAGRPILHKLLSAEVQNVGCAVVRFYGGKKLGIPGLIEAYGSAAEDALHKAAIKQLPYLQQTMVSIELKHQYKLFNLLNRLPGVRYEFNKNQFIINCLESFTPELQTELRKIDTLVILNEV
jgi:putative IMPACT (imprinted ancient) family translation regulator